MKRETSMARTIIKVFPFLAAFALILALGLIRKDRFRPYEVLGIGRDATQEEVKEAYRRLVLENHPDKNKAPDAHEKFIRIRRAYELLSNPWTKRNYDYDYDSQGVIEDYLLLTWLLKGAEVKVYIIWFWPILVKCKLI